MTNGQRALQIWSVLVAAARNQQVLSYATVQDLVGVPQHALTPLFGSIEAYCRRRQYPHLTAIVIDESTGLPGDILPGHASATGLEVLRNQSRVFVFDWLKHKPPSEDDFQQ
jgi:hypothetical protein